MVRPKNAWMGHCAGSYWEGGIKDFLKEGGSEKGN